MKKTFLALLAGWAVGIAHAQAPIPELPQPVAVYALEDKDWGIEPTRSPKMSGYHAPTPTTIPGARVLKALELQALLAANKEVVVIDVLNSSNHRSVPGAFQMSKAGDGRFFGAEKARFADALDSLTAGSKSRPVVFLCLSSECWLSYNASLHALEAGYQDVLWFRGGTDAWRGANLELVKPESVRW